MMSLSSEAHHQGTLVLRLRHFNNHAIKIITDFDLTTETAGVFNKPHGELWTPGRNLGIEVLLRFGY